MDDNLEQPSSAPPRPTQEEETAEFSGDDDEGPDWTKLKSFASSCKPSLPKRGDKEFEPAVNGPTKLQSHSLNRARDAMFGALSTERGISNKSVSYAVWYPDLSRAHVTQARGVLFNGMGHSVARPACAVPGTSENKPKPHKRTELLPEETLYLIERGSLFCWRDAPNARFPAKSEGGQDEHSSLDEHDMRGAPMSVQQAYAEMIGRDELTLERYQAYAYLKRLGFVLLRAKPPSPYYPTPAPPIPSNPPYPQSLSRVFSRFKGIFARFRAWISGGVNWWKPVSFGWLGCARNYHSVYAALRLIPSGHKIPLKPPLPASTPLPSSSSPGKLSDEDPTPYEIFYNVYKPNTPFRKSTPPPPDFSLVVVNARTTPLPSLHELTYLWSFLPENPPPVPRQRTHQKPILQHPTKNPTPTLIPSRSTPTSPLFSRLLHLLSPLLRHPTKPTPSPSSSSSSAPPPRPPHPFAILKNGRKTIVIGVVDSGTVGFFRFGMGAFEDMPMI